LKGLIMCQITITLPDETLASLHVSPEGMAEELRMAAAVKLFELERLSSGAAATLAGVPRTVFLSRLADYGVDTFRMTENDIQRERRIA
jgi:predicted HTH domain antitoxin